MKVLIADKFDEAGIGRLGEAGCEVICDAGLQGDALTNAIKKSGCQVLIVRSTRVSKAMIDAGAELKLIIRAGSGYDTIDVAAASDRSVRVCNCPGQNAVAVAELTVGLMIALDRRIVDNTNDLRRGVWNKKEYSKAGGLKRRTLGIVGLGRIGYEVAKRAAAFEMLLVYFDVIDHPEIEKELGIVKATLEGLLGQSDFVTLHTPGGKGTEHLIGEAQLRMMKPTAFLINCCRGGVVDEAALAAALEAGTMAGAALDVFEIEPGATDKEFTDPISKAPRVYGTHHIGASTEQAQSAVADEAVRIVRAFFDEGQFINCVNPP